MPLIQRQPDDLAGHVAGVAVRRLGEGVGELPFLRFVAPLGGRVGDDVVRVAIGTDRRRPGGSGSSPIDAVGRLLFQVERIEK